MGIVYLKLMLTSLWNKQVKSVVYFKTKIKGTGQIQQESKTG